MGYSCVRQTDETDCGAACIATICKHYKKELPLSYIRELSKTDKHGTNMLGLKNAGQQLGFDCKGLKGSKEELLAAELTFPFIAHIVVDDILDHYVVIHNIDTDSITIADPAKGISSLSYDDFFSVWRGFVLTLVPNATFDKACIKVKPLWSYFKLVFHHKKTFSVIFVISTLMTLLSTGVTYFFQYLVDFAIPSAAISRLIYVSCAVIAVHLLLMGFTYCRNRLLALLTKQLNLSIITEYLTHLVSLPMEFFEKRTIGDIVSRFSDADNIRDAISSVSITVMLDAGLMCVGCIILASINFKLFVIALGFIILYGISVFIFNKPIKNITQQLRDHDTETTSHLIETVEGIEIIKAYNKDEQTLKHNLSLMEKLLNSSYAATMIITNEINISGTIISIAQIAILCIGGIGVISENLSIGELMTFYTMFSLFINPVRSLIDLQPTIQQASVSAQRLSDVLIVTCENDSGAQATTPFCFQQQICFDNISFQYGNRKPVLQGITFSIQKGQKIGVVGNSGSGKSTLIKLLLRFYDPASGQIRIDNTDISDIDHKQLRAKIGYVPQNTFLFRGTVLENLKYGLDVLTDDEVKERCKELNVESFIMSFPFGYETLLAEKGENLSSGQRQIITIIRALIGEKDIFILDEATSNLDTITERLINMVINNVCNNKTFIVIAHRLETVKNCDRLLVLKDGSIVGNDCHTKLLKENEYYQELWNKQTV